MIRIFTFFILLHIFCFSDLLAGTYSGGNGTVGNPYQISTTEDLIELSKTPADWASGKYFIQTAQIVFSSNPALVDWDGDGTLEHPGDDDTGFSPIGNNTTKFSGSYDGQFHSVINLYINRATTDYIGLFGYADQASISNLGVVKADITGKEYVGGLIGYISEATLSSSFSNGSVVGQLEVGGLVGRNQEGTISNSFSSAFVESDNDAGGLVGYNLTGTISNCFSAGSVTRSSGSSTNFGGFCGNFHQGTIQYCYSVGVVYQSAGTIWNVGGNKNKGFAGRISGSPTTTGNFFDSDSSQQTTGTGATARTTIQMKTTANYTDASWDFGNDETDWVMSSPVTFDRYPTFRWTKGYSVAPTGTPRKIISLPNLVWIAEAFEVSEEVRWSYAYDQTANIDMQTSPCWDNGNGWTPIGGRFQGYPSPFVGEFNGNNFTVSNLYINRREKNDIGFFGFTVGQSSKILNKKLSNVIIIGRYFVGALVGYNGVSISNCYSSGSVSAYNSVGGVGGLVGHNDYGTISNCYSTVSVSISSNGFNIGGFVGSNNKGTISNCYSSGSVSGTYWVGGLVGDNYGTISNCYSSGSVSGNNYVGGLVGRNESGTISNCYSSGSVSGDVLVGGLVGFNIGTISNCYSTGSVSGINRVGGLVGLNYYGTVSNCFWDTQTSGKTTSEGGTGKTTAEMKTLSTFTSAGWNFSTIWRINPAINNGYPYLRNFHRIYVDHTAIGDNDGSSWEDAFTSFQSALNEATLGDEIWVAAGTYKPSSPYDLTNSPRYYHFRMINGVEIYGGFAGDEDPNTFDLADRDFEANETILSGDIGTPDNFSDNCYHIFYLPSSLGLTSSAILDGFIIEDGYADNPSSHYYYGAGILFEGGSPILNNIVLRDHRASNGAGIFINGASPTFKNSTFSSNYSSDAGGAVQIQGNSTPVFTNILIHSNTAAGTNGGGIVNLSSNNVVFNNLTIYGNTANQYGGGIYNNGYVTFNNTIVWGNLAYHANYPGNQVFNYGGVSSFYYSCVSTNSGDTWQTSGAISYDANTIHVNPLFVDPDNGDFRIVGLSPAVDAGNDAYNSEDFDIRSVGFPRKLDKNDHTQVGTIDMGAYEYKEGTDPLGCFSAVYVSDDYDSNTPGWQVTHHDNLSYALAIACDGATVNISDYTHTGNVDMTGYTFIIGDGDFYLNGTLSGGLIQTPSTGSLILPAVQNVQRNYPLGNGSNNFTLKIIPMNEPTNPILVRLVEKSVPGALKSPMPFWEIEGDDDLDATIVFRIEKSAIAPKTLNKNSILRFFDGDKYVPVTEEQVTINDMGSYYEVIIINVNKF